MTNTNSTVPDSVAEYIRQTWGRSVCRDQNGSGFAGIDLPHPYTPPSLPGEGKFSFFFYWDTYFTNVGLLRHEQPELVRGNIRNMFWLIERQGYMPNHVGIFNRSQPPYLWRMVRDYVEATGDEDFLRESAPFLRQEYNFWITARQTPTGLCRHGHHDTREGCLKFFRTVAKRRGLPDEGSEEEKIRNGGHHLAEAETGCDFTPRFDGRCMDFNPVQLNCLLWEYEVALADFSQKFHWGQDDFYHSQAALRKERINQYLWNRQRGLFLEYDFSNARHSQVADNGTFLPLFTGLASEEQAERVRANLNLFELDHGLAVTEKCPDCESYQWAWPNMWPCMVYVTVEGLRRYGFEEDAQRIARKYVEDCRRLFEKTGQLWEKIDARTGEVAGGEYDAAPMLGWSAGVYLAMLEIC